MIGRSVFFRALISAVTLLATSGVAVWAVDGAPVQAKKSELFHPSDARIWADAAGAVVSTLPDVPRNTVLQVRALVFQPKGDNLTWSELTQMLALKGALRAGQKPVFSAAKLATGEAATADPEANTEETNVYAGRTPDEFVVLGFIRNQRTQHQIAYEVVLKGPISAVQATAQGRSLSTMLALTYKFNTSGPPRPQGAVPTGPSRSLAGQQLRLLLESIEKSPTLARGVKSTARVVIPQATKVELWNFRTLQPFSDALLVNFYMNEAVKLGWGTPISRDESQPNRPTLLFQRPNETGVVMVSAEPVPPVPGSGSATLISILVIDGKINTGSLVPTPRRPE